MIKHKVNLSLLILMFTVTVSLFYSCKKYGKLMAVETGSVANVMATGAEVDALVIDVGESGVSEHGWCMGTSPNPTVNDFKINNGAKENYGGYTNLLTGLDPGTKYYLRSFISGSGKTIYGEQVELITSDLLFTINYPKVDEILGIGLNYKIEWSANINDKIKIELYKADSLKKTIVEEMENSGEYAWTIGTDVIDGNDYKVVIRSAENEKVKAETPIFSIRENSPPMVITREILNIDFFTAQAGGSIEHFGIESSASQHGHCWGTNENPTIADSKTELGNKTNPGVFTSDLTGLLENTVYYVKAYATNSIGTSYGEQKIFTTLDATKPAVTTAILSNISYFTATGGGEVTSAGTHPVTSRGVCWSTSANPTSTDNKTIDGTGAGSFTSSLTGLTGNTTYYVRAYATNSVGTAYGEQRVFTTLQFGTLTDYDGNIYKTVAIGSQIWMAENLKSTHDAGGSVVSSYVYNNDANNVATYGRLYVWYSAMNNSTNVQGICPTGWHIPTDSECQILIDFLGGNAVAGGKMKEAGIDHWSTPNTGADNSSGFNCLPAGFYDPYTNMGLAGYFWSSTEVGLYSAWSRNLYHDKQDVVRGSTYKGDAISVRCIKD